VNRWKWPAIVIGMLTVHVLACLFFIYLATSDPSFAVEEDYYQKAVGWDEKRAQDRRNAVLGWQVALQVEPAATVAHDPVLRVVLTDRQGRPIDGARLAVEAFPVARADRIQRLTGAGSGAGVYGAPVSIRRPGRWEFRVVAELDDDRFTTVETVHVIP
jgi:nitrogen fixation protein FixH